MGWLDNLRMRKRQATTAPAKPAVAASDRKPIGGLLGQGGAPKPTAAPTAAPKLMARFGRR